MKKIYMVRHGESEGNVGTFMQGPTTILSDHGKIQIETVAERFSTIAIDIVISSPYQRTKHTALSIADVLKKEIIFSDLLVERRRPSVVIGKAKTDPIVIEVGQLIRKNIHIPNWHYSDEENFEDLKNRAAQLFTYLETLEEENILLVTHGIFMRMIMAYVVFEKELTSREWEKFLIVFFNQNTGITLLEQKKFNDEDLRWHVTTWNDHAHLGEIKK